jgi:hypothetical protein
VAFAVAAGGAPLQVIVYVTVPGLASDKVLDPDGATAPNQPSPDVPPPATQESEWIALHVNVIDWLTVAVARLAANETAGAGATGEDAATGV